MFWYFSEFMPLKMTQIPFRDNLDWLEGPPELFVDLGLLLDLLAFNLFWALIGVSPGASRPPWSWGIRIALKSTPTEKIDQR